MPDTICNTSPLIALDNIGLLGLLEFWFFERFRGLTAQEVWAMLNVITPLQETKAYQSIPQGRMADAG